MTTTDPTTETYAAAYQELSVIAQRLSSSNAATTIDTLAADVKAARRYYKICRERLEAIRREIELTPSEPA